MKAHKYPPINIILFILLLLNCDIDRASAQTPSFAPPATQAGKLPEAPVFLRQTYHVETKNGKSQALTPAIPSMRTSLDGRVGYDWTNSGFFILGPENIDGSFLLGRPGFNFLITKQANYSAYPQNILNKDKTPDESDGLGRYEGATICNPQGAKEQPYVCHGQNDCYEITLMGFHVESDGSSQLKNSGRFRSRRLLVEVASPKTPNARIISISPIGPLKESPFLVTVDIETNDSNQKFLVLEPVMTHDGRLYVMRLGYRKLHGEFYPRAADIVYMVAPQNADPCDASTFATPKTITYAYHDPNMRDPSTGVARYGLAEYPMRDALGKAIDQRVGFGTYPWIDHQGNNLFFLGVDSSLFRPETGESRYEVACVNEPCNSPQASENFDNDKGMAVIGSWTHGKAVLLDGMLNHSDFGLKRDEASHRMVHLYQDGSNTNGWIRVGSGRDNRWETAMDGFIHLSGVIESFQNLFNAYTVMRPTLPRDIVWTMNNNLTSDEIAFDDYLESRALIISTMTGSMSLNGSWWKYHNGYSRFQTSQTESVLIQNAATTLDYPIPAYGYLDRGRLEPVALGGIHGKGLWLDNATLTYGFSKPVINSAFFISIFLDPRSTDRTTKKILSFPDGTELKTSENTLIISKHFDADNIDVIQKTNLKLEPQKWTHLGLATSTDGRVVTIYVNGMAYASFSKKRPLFRLKSQNQNGAIEVKLGKSKNGFRGWVDDFKVFAYVPTPEVICNHAYGSLYALRPEANQNWIERANFYPETSHQDIFRRLPETFTSEVGLASNSRFVCAVDYSSSVGIYKAKLRANEGLLPLREALLFANPVQGSVADGRLFWNSPRVDYRQNNFCLSCHGAKEHRGLSLNALAPGSVCSMNDLRRQPLQPPSFLTGIVRDSQLDSILREHSRVPKLTDGVTGALHVDPYVLLHKNGESCQSNL